MFSLPRLVKRGALVGAIVALVVAAAALSPRRADAQFGFGGCFLQPVTSVQPIATLTGFVIWQPVTILQTICPGTFIGSPFFTGGGFIGSALSFNPSFFRTCPSSLGCFFGNVNSVHFQTTGQNVNPCHNSCRPQHANPCPRSCRRRP